MRLTSADGRWWWNGHCWQPVTQPGEAETNVVSAGVAAQPPPAATHGGAVPSAGGAPEFMPGRYARTSTAAPGSGIARLALTGEVATGFSLGRSIPGAVEPV